MTDNELSSLHLHLLTLSLPEMKSGQILNFLRNITQGCHKKNPGHFLIVLLVKANEN